MSTHEAPVPAFVLPRSSDESAPFLLLAPVVEGPLAEACASAPACEPTPTCAPSAAMCAPAPALCEAPAPAKSMLADWQPEKLDDAGCRGLAIDRQPALLVPALLLSASCPESVDAARRLAGARRQQLHVPETLVVEACRRRRATVWTASEGCVKGSARIRKGKGETTMRGQERWTVLRATATHLSVVDRVEPASGGLEPRGVRQERLRKREGSRRPREDASHPAAVEVSWHYTQGERCCSARALNAAQLEERLSRLGSAPLLLQRWMRPRKVDHHLRVTWLRNDELCVVRIPAPTVDAPTAEKVEAPVEGGWLRVELGKLVDGVVEHVRHVAGRLPVLLRLVFKLGQANTLALLWCEDCVFDERDRPSKKRLRVAVPDRATKKPFAGLRLFAQAAVKTPDAPRNTPPSNGHRASKPPRCAHSLPPDHKRLPSPPAVPDAPVVSSMARFNATKVAYSRPLAPRREDVDAPVHPAYARTYVAPRSASADRPKTSRGPARPSTTPRRVPRPVARPLVAY